MSDIVFLFLHESHYERGVFGTYINRKIQDQSEKLHKMIRIFPVYIDIICSISSVSVS